MPVTALLELGADIGWPDLETAGAARLDPTPLPGRFAELVEWLAAIQGRFPPRRPGRPRAVVLGAVPDHVAHLGSALRIGLCSLGLDHAPGKAFKQGADSADREVDEGADLLVLSGRDDSPASAALVSLLSGAEPVALLPRGADAVDSAAWIATAQHLRDMRRRLVDLRSRPDELLAELASPVIAAAAGFALRAAARRTGVVLEGSAVLAAALLCVDSQPRAREWWQIADTSSDPAQNHALDRLARRPLLDLRAGVGDGMVGLLAVAVLRAAAPSGGADE